MINSVHPEDALDVLTRGRAPVRIYQCLCCQCLSCQCLCPKSEISLKLVN